MRREMEESVLEIEGLHFGYTKDRPLYRDLSLHLKRGEIVAVLGPSGSGKSTLFELIAGHLRPWRGTIRKKGFSQVFQDPYTSFHPTYTLRDQIADVADLSGLERLCERVGVDQELLDRRPHELSGGQLQRASIVRALAMRPDLVLADEPTSALDNLTQLEVMRLLVETLDRVGILLITHDEDLARWCADRIVRVGH